MRVLELMGLLGRFQRNASVSVVTRASWPVVEEIVMIRTRDELQTTGWRIPRTPLAPHDVLLLCFLPPEQKLGPIGTV